MPDEAFRVHGLSQAFLAEHPLFAAVVDGFLEFIEDSPLVIHNATFDLKFLNAELAPRRPAVAAGGPGDRHAADGAAQVPGRACQSRRLDAAVRHRRLEPDAARGAARQRALGRGLHPAARRPAGRARACGERQAVRRRDRRRKAAAAATLHGCQPTRSRRTRPSSPRSRTRSGTAERASLTSRRSERAATGTPFALSKSLD